MKPIGVYPICNTGGVLVYKIESDRVLAAINNDFPEYCEIEEIERDGEYKTGFFCGDFFVDFDLVQRYF